ncbi:DUF1491 family protein [Kordiimonas sp.]|uniref:DUF1491 family protein n=1 Tax=Kordiimonas sp. TaxID=1970157 RepID=UPI003A95B7B0
MQNHRLTSKLWVDAHVRTCHIAGCPAFVVSRGDGERGGILLKVNRFAAGVDLYELSRDFDGNRIWRRLGPEAGEPESDADGRILKKRKFDSDLWVIEIEDMGGKYVCDAPVSAL